MTKGTKRIRVTGCGNQTPAPAVTEPAPAATAGKDLGQPYRLDMFFRIVDMPSEDGKSMAHAGKSFTAIKDGDRIVDYQDVTIRGYLSTFVGTTAADREGDYVKPGAFKDSIPEFMRNPVMLRDHVPTCENAVGYFTVVKEDAKGLYVEGKLSNSPDDDMVDLRFKVAEGIIRTMSMGGVFLYEPDGRGIAKVNLFEGTLTPLPVNQDAIFSVRAFKPDELKHLRLRVTRG